MELTQNDNLEVQRFCQSIISKPIPIDDQKHTRSNGHVWCKDWEIIEICKYLFNGRTAYYGDPPPNRLKNNPLWSKDEIAKRTESIIAECGTVDKIIAYLKNERNPK